MQQNNENPSSEPIESLGKLIFFYALLLGVLLLGLFKMPWITVLPLAVFLSFAYIWVRGKSWRNVIGNAELAAPVVFVAVFISLLLVTGLFFAAGRGIRLLLF